MTTHDLQADDFAAQFREAEARLVLGLTRAAALRASDERIQPSDASPATHHLNVGPSPSAVPHE